MPIYVFNLALECKLTSSNSYERKLIPAIGFSGATGFEDLPKILPIARKYLPRVFVTHYPTKELLVAAAHPHFESDLNDAPGFRRIYDAKNRRMIKREEVFIKCPSLSKFNACGTCHLEFASLPCLAKCLRELKEDVWKCEFDPLDYETLKPACHSSPPLVPRRKLGPEFIWTAPSHAAQYRFRSKDGVVRTVSGVTGSAEKIEESIESYRRAGIEGLSTRALIVAKCPQCCFDNYCKYRRWQIRGCPPEGFKTEKLVEELMDKVNQNLMQQNMTRDELEFFINAGGHTVYPYRYQMIFRSLTGDFSQGFFTSGNGRRHYQFNIPTTKRLLQAKFFINGNYTNAVTDYSQKPVHDELVGCYYELCKQERYKTSNGWTPYASIESISLSGGSLKLDFFHQGYDVRVYHYAALYRNLPRRLSIE
jgi:hypothetical protein